MYSPHPQFRRPQRLRRPPPLRFRSPKPKRNAPTTQNPRPEPHEKSETRPRKIRDPTTTRALLTAVSKKLRIVKLVKYDCGRVSWSVSPQEQRSHTNSGLGNGCGTLESNTPTVTARCTVASARCTCCALRRTVGSSWARHT
jgi:hypothetical protein